jgi:hypothetical protein
MYYAIDFSFIDDKAIRVRVPQEEMVNFMKAISAGEVYRCHKLKRGLWIAINNVRFFEVAEVNKPLDEIQAFAAKRCAPVKGGGPKRTNQEVKKDWDLIGLEKTKPLRDAEWLPS